MKIICLADLHGHLPKVSSGDMLIVAGDLTAHNLYDEYLDFLDWMKEQDFRYKILVGGNHDGYLHSDGMMFSALCKKKKIRYLQDSSCVIKGYTIHGMPWTPTFMNWHFMADPARMSMRVSLIPDKTDILVTHGPAWGLLDECNGQNLGCKILRDRCESLDNLTLHVHGHIHSAYGKTWIGKDDFKGYQVVNASIMNQNYEPVNAPVEVYL